MKRYNRKHARRSLFHTAFFRALSQAATLASYVVLVRGMSEHAFGVLNLLYAVLPLLSTAASFGIEQTLRRYQPEYLRSGNLDAAAWLVRVAGRARFASNVVLLGVILLLWHVVAPVFKLEAYRSEFLLFGALILLHFQSVILQLSLSSHMRQGYSVGMTVVLAVGKLIAYLALTYFDNLTLTNAILADTAGYALMYAGLRIAYVKHCIPETRNPDFKIEPQERRRLLRYSFFNNFNDAGTLLLTSKTDNFFIAALMNPAAVGAYSFYIRLNTMVGHLLPLRQFSNVIQPLFFAVPAAEAMQRIPRYFTLLLNVTLVLQFPILAYTTTYHAEIVAVLFGGKFADDSWMLPLVMAFSTLNLIADPSMLVAQYKEKVGVILFSKVFGIYNAVMLLVLVPMWGIYGAALATGSAQLLKNIFVWWHVRDMARWSNLRAVVGIGLLIWSLVVFAGYALKEFLQLNAMASLACGVILCGIGMLLYVRTPAISTSDRQIVASVMHGRERTMLVRLGFIQRA